MNDKRALILSIGMVFILACSVSFGNPTAPPPAAQPSLPVLPTFTPLPTYTSVPPAPMAYISTATACHAGPGETYDLISDLTAGQRLDLAGRGGAYWIVRLADGRECWVDAAAVTIEGDAAALAERVPPPVPTPSAPKAPSDLQLVHRSCVRVMVGGVPKYEIEFTISWKDNSNNEDGFYVYRDNDKVGELEPNSTQMTDSYVVRTGGKTIVYYVVAYNGHGLSQSQILSLANPCFN